MQNRNLKTRNEDTANEASYDEILNIVTVIGIGLGIILYLFFSESIGVTVGVALTIVQFTERAYIRFMQVAGFDIRRWWENRKAQQQS